MYQHRNIHIHGTWLQQIPISNSENKIYLHIHTEQNSVNDTNIQQTETYDENSEDDYSDVDNNEASVANRDTLLGRTPTDI